MDPFLEALWWRETNQSANANENYVSMLNYCVFGLWRSWNLWKLKCSNYSRQLKLTLTIGYAMRVYASDMSNFLREQKKGSTSSAA